MLRSSPSSGVLALALRGVAEESLRYTGKVDKLGRKGQRLHGAAAMAVVAGGGKVRGIH